MTCSLCQSPGTNHTNLLGCVQHWQQQADTWRDVAKTLADAVDAARTDANEQRIVGYGEGYAAGNVLLLEILAVLKRGADFQIGPKGKHSTLISRIEQQVHP